MTTEKWSKLTRQDLRHCDDLATELVLLAMDIGGVGRIGRRGHLIIKAPSGRTFTLAPNLPVQNRAAQNSKAQFRQVFGLSVEQARERVEAMAREERTEKVAESRKSVSNKVGQATNPELFWCPIKDCSTPKFTSLESLLGHVEHAHFVCKQNHEQDAKKFPGLLPNGWVAIPTAQGAAGHRRIVHEGVRPRPKGMTKDKLRKRVEPAPPVEAEPVVADEEETIETVSVAPVAPVAREPQVKPEAHTVVVPEDKPWVATTDYIAISRAATAEEILQAVRALVGGEDTRKELMQLRERNKQLEAEVKRLHEVEIRWNMLREQFGLVEKL